MSRRAKVLSRWEEAWYSVAVKIIDAAVTREELRAMAQAAFGNLVKAVVDISRGIMALDGELHADEEALLLENGSRQRDLWGINIYPNLEEDDRVEFDSMINIRPSQGNLSRGVDDQDLRKKIIEIVNKLVTP